MEHSVMHMKTLEERVAQNMKIREMIKVVNAQLQSTKPQGDGYILDSFNKDQLVKVKHFLSSFTE